MVRALLLQKLEKASRKIPHHGAPRRTGTRRKRRSGGHRGRRLRGLQDGKPQSSLVHRALPGRRDGSRGNTQGHIHHGSAARGPSQFPSLRKPRRREDEISRRRSGVRNSGLRKLHGDSHGGRRSVFRRLLRRKPPRKRFRAGSDEKRQDLPRIRLGGGKSGHICRLEDRKGRNTGSHNGVGHVYRGKRGKTPRRAGRRPLHGKTPSRSLPRAF